MNISLSPSNRNSSSTRSSGSSTAARSQFRSYPAERFGIRPIENLDWTCRRERLYTRKQVANHRKLPPGQEGNPVPRLQETRSNGTQRGERFEHANGATGGNPPARIAGCPSAPDQQHCQF